MITDILHDTMKNLATIQRIKNVRECPDSDKLDLVQVLGWQVVTKRREFKENELCVYIVIDTVLPETSDFEFLRNKQFRIKPIRIRGQTSAGICFPLSILKTDKVFSEGDCVTDLLQVKHYERPMPAQLKGDAVGGIPSFLIITDELNLRSYPDAISELYGKSFYITKKIDGSSGSFFIKGNEFGVTSRRIHLKPSKVNGFWQIAYKYNIENAIKEVYPDRDIAIQGEVVGPGIQKNPLGLKELEFHVFNVFDIKNRYYLGYNDIIHFCKSTRIPMVHTIEEGSTFGYSLEELIQLANRQKYYIGTVDTVPAEGIVIRPQESFYSKILKKPFSGKIINENYDI